LSLEARPRPDRARAEAEIHTLLPSCSPKNVPLGPANGKTSSSN
jgi:hypothetical protein